MANTFAPRLLPDLPVNPSSGTAAPTKNPGQVEVATKPSHDLRTALLTLLVSVLAVQAATMAMILLMTDVSLLAAVGFGAYCAFWLGGGFGTIFGSAMVFGRSH